MVKDVSFLKEHGVDVDKSLELFGDMATYNATLPEFLNGIKTKMPQLEEYKAKADMANYAIIVHSLKSDAKYFGFMPLADCAYQHELESKANHADYIYQHYDELLDKVRNAVSIVQEYLEDTSDDNILELTPNQDNNLKQKILIVDDSAVITSFVKKIFSNQYDVITADDGKEALKIIEETTDGSIAAMLLDIMMPNVNGFGVLEYFKNHNLFTIIPVSIITGAYTKEVIDMVFQYDIVDILAKPFNEQNVKNVIEKTIQRKELLGSQQ